MQRSGQKGRRILWWMAAITAVLGLTAGVFMYNNCPPNIHVPTPKLPHPNAWDSFYRACLMLKTQKSPSPASDIKKRPEQWTIQDYHAFLAADGLAIAAFRKALLEPYHVPPIGSLADMDKSFERCALFREMARTVLGEGMCYEGIRQYGRAMDRYLDAIEFGVTVRAEETSSP